MKMSNQILCRLCLEEGETLLEVHSEIGIELGINEVITQHFWFNIKEDDQISNKICTSCWNKIEEFHNLYNRVQRAQERITVIYDSQIHMLDEKQNLRNIIMRNDPDHNKDQIAFEIFKVENQVEGELVAQIDNFENSSVDEIIEEVILEDEKDKTPSPEPQHQSETEKITTYFRKTRKRRKSKQLRDSRSTSKEKENSDNTSMYIDDYQSKDEEYSPEVTIKREKRKPIKKELIEAEKEKEEKLIETYYKMVCEICHDNFDKFEMLFEHYQSIHCIRGFILCCGKKFHRRPVIAEHVLWHTNPDLFKCKICNKVYADKRCLSNHLLAHAPPDMKLFKCDRCPKSFVKKFKLDQHKLSHLTPEEKKYICDDCQKPYASDALLRAHKRVVHEKTYAHMCEICAKVFKSRVFFEKHQLEHLGQNLPRVQCQICSAWMKNEHTMRAHMRLHQDAGMIHRCDVCGKQGPSRNAILKHKRFVHLSERKFKCTLCEKAFKRAITLKEHMTVHTGEVLYTCTFCPKTFNSGANMHAHKKKTHTSEWEIEKRSKQLFIKPEGFL